MTVSPLVAFAGLVTIGLLAMRLPRLRWPHVPSLDLLLAAGLPPVLVGVLLGPGIDLLNRSALGALTPVTAVCIGWIGAALGARFEARYVRRIPRAAWLLASGSAAAAFVVVALAVWLLTRLVPPLAAAWAPRLPAILTLAAVAAVAGPGALTLTARISDVPPRATRAFSLVATLEAAIGAVAVTVPLALHRASAAGGPVLGWLWWLVLALASGALVGTVFLAIARLLDERGTLGLAFVAAMVLGTGLGYAAGLSPFVVCAVATALIVNRSPHRQAVRRVLAGWERLIYALVLVATGALLMVPTAWILVAAALVAALRAAAQWATVRFGRVPLHLTAVPPDAGLGTVTQGGVAIALGLSFLLTYGAQGLASGDATLTTIVLGVGVTQLAALPLMNRALAGERSRQPAMRAAATPLTPAAAAPELSANAPVEWGGG